jgi:hypothetical protein
MFVKLAATVCIALFIGGCGGEAMEEEEAGETVESVAQPFLWLCDGSDTWVRNWYTNFQKTVWVGSEKCNCNGITLCGTKGNYYTQQGIGACPGSSAGGCLID